jgi:putative hydrolase of the HAD superfamily
MESEMKDGKRSITRPRSQKPPMPPISSTIRAILFDAVGTLIYPDPSVAEVYRREGQKLGSKYSADEIGERFRASIKQHYQGGQTSELRELERWRRIVYEVIDDVDDAQELLLTALWRHFGSPSAWRLFDDVSPAWREYSRRGYLLGIASNFDSRLRTVCRGHPPLHECRQIFVSSEVGYAKPEPGYYRAVQEQLGLLPEQILLIGDDAAADVAGPLAAGWHALWLRRDERTFGSSLSAISSLVPVSDAVVQNVGSSQTVR